jgi:hypothetical protein
LWSVPGPRGSAQRAMKFNYVTASGSEHVGLKKTLVPMLSRQRVTAQFEAIRTITSRCVAGWPVGREVDLYSLARRRAADRLHGPVRGHEPRPGARLRRYGGAVPQRQLAGLRPISR